MAKKPQPEKPKIPEWIAEVLPITGSEEQRLDDICSGWKNLNHFLPTLTERDLVQALYLEVTGRKRAIMISRLSGRLHKVRNRRENQELFLIGQIAT